jgi:hypothetical protein
MGDSRIIRVKDIVGLINAVSRNRVHVTAEQWKMEKGLHPNENFEYEKRITSQGTFVRITGYRSDDAVAKIPEMIDGYQVVDIGSRAFAGNTTVTKVILPPTIAYIGAHAFSLCESLREINFPCSIMKMGDMAFSCCYSLRKVDLSNTQVTELSRGCFDHCKTLQEIVFPQNLKTIRGRAMAGTPLNRIVLPASVESVEAGAFQHETSERVHCAILGMHTALERGAFDDPYNLILYCLNGSEAKRYAIENRILCEDLRNFAAYDKREC